MAFRLVAQCLNQLRYRCVQLQGKQCADLLQPTAPNLQHTANQERNDQCGIQQYSRELLMMGIVMTETC